MRKSKLYATIFAAALFSLAAAAPAMAAWRQEGNVWKYYNDNNGQMARDQWIETSGQWYYVNYDGVMQANTMVDDTYYVNENGVMVVNTWVLLNDGWGDGAVWRYFGSNGKAYTNGWKQIGDSWYHFSDTVMDTGWLDLDGDVYYVGTSGAMATGWKELPDENGDWGVCWYYFSSNGKRASGGEKAIGGETYIFDDYGRMLSGWVCTSDYTSSGRDDLSTHNVNSLKYFREGGQEMSGWRYLPSPEDAEENWYYFRDGRAYTAEYKTTSIGDGYGLAKISGETYCFDRQGRMITGLVEISDGKKFYFDTSGAMKTGRVVVNDDNHDNEVFYFTTTGSLGDKGDGYTGVKDGYLYEEGLLIRAEEGMRYEKVSVDGKDYLVNEQGKVKTSGTATDADGVKYEVEKKSDGSYSVRVVN